MAGGRRWCRTLKLISGSSTWRRAPMLGKASGKDWRTLGREEVDQRGNSSPTLKARMTYPVNITQRAQQDLADLYDRIHAESSPAAGRWYQGLKAAILSLEQQPNRCPVIRKQQKLRHLLHGEKPNVYRVLYRLLERRKQVEIVHIPARGATRSKATRLGRRNTRIARPERVWPGAAINAALYLKPDGCKFAKNVLPRNFRLSDECP